MATRGTPFNVLLLWHYACRRDQLVSAIRGRPAELSKWAINSASAVRGRLFQAVDPTLDRNEPFVLTGGEHEDVGQLLQRVLDLGDPLINALQFGPHAVVGAGSGQHETHDRQDMTVIDRRVEFGFRFLNLAAVDAHGTTPIRSKERYARDEFVCRDYRLKIRATSSIE